MRLGKWMLTGHGTQCDVNPAGDDLPIDGTDSRDE